MPTLDGEVDMASYADRLKALHADVNLFNHVKFFIHDLFQFDYDAGAQLRVLQCTTANFYMNSVYFTPKQVDILISFKGRDGLTLEEALQPTTARKLLRARNNSASRYEISYAVHDLASVLQDLFGVKKGFYVEHGFKRLFNKFAKNRLD